MLYHSVSFQKGKPTLYFKYIMQIQFPPPYTANILTVLCTAFGSVTFPSVFWLCMLQLKTASDLKLYSSMSLSVMGTAIGCEYRCQIEMKCNTANDCKLAVNICSVH